MNEKIEKILEDSISANLIQIVISNGPSSYEVKKIKVRPILLKQVLVYQASKYVGKQIFHNNLTKQEVILDINESITLGMKQIQISTQEKEHTILISKKGTVTIKSKNLVKENKAVELNHNRKKKYILEEGRSVPFLVDLGVMTTDGKIVNSKYDKYKQINRYLEFIEDILPNLDKDRELTIIDFGCGKSYLTFAMYYYLKVLKGYDIKVIGLDLKVDVIKHCSDLAISYGYDKLVFLEGDIASYMGVNQVDMVVTLHACDTATDYALAKAVEWGASVILSVPCCQHEINSQIKNEILNPVLSYGLIKERMSSLLTDGIRAELLELAGYKTGVLEFIDMEHTPKNILLRGVKRQALDKLTEEQKDSYVKEQKKRLEEFHNLTGAFHIKPKLYELLNQMKKITW